MNSNSQLLQLIEGCLNPNTVSASTQKLVQYSNRPTFISELLQLVPNQRQQILIMIISTLKNFVQGNYNSLNSSIPPGEKDILRNNIFNFFYEISHCHQAVNLYKDVVYEIVCVDFQNYSELFSQCLKEDLNGSIMASVYFCAQVARYYQWLTYEKRQPFENFISAFFPRLEGLAEQILSNYNEQTRVFLNELLNMFYVSFHLEVPHYLRNFQNLSKWLLYFKTVLQAPLNDYPHNHTIVSRIYVKLFSMYCRDGTDGKQYRGWGRDFRNNYAEDLYNQVISQLVNPIPDEDTVSNMVTCLCTVANNVDLRPLLKQDHCQTLIQKHLIPFMQSTNEDNKFFNSDGLEYIRRKQDLTLHPFRTASLQFIKSIMANMVFEEKSQLIKFVEYSANILGGDYSDAEKEVILIILIDLNRLILRNKFLKDNFERLVKQYFIPLMNSSNQIIVATSISVLESYLELTSLSTQTVRELLAILYEKMTGTCLVIKFYAMIAFTKLLDDDNALDQIRPHFQSILEIFVKMMDVINHEKLIGSLETVVKSFSGEIAMFAQGLSSHLFTLFHTYHNKQDIDGDDEAENNQASAALSTIKQILDSNLSAQSYFSISENVIILLRNLSEYDDYFQEIINLFNTLIYRSGNIVDFEFPYLLFYKLLEGDNGILNNCGNQELIQIVSQTEKADDEYAETLISVLKNLIQKMPQQILHQYPYPFHPEIILCLIQNKKIPASTLGNLNLSGIDHQWGLILQSYTAFIYGVGQICDLNELKMLNGISLYPWIQQKMGLDVIKRVLFVLEEEQAEDDYYQQNTMQMLEQMANEDDDDDNADQFYVSDGGNYSFNYDSPFDSSKDREQVVAKLRQLNNNDLGYLLSQLKPRFRTKLQSLMGQYQ